jgi:Macrocin-O-methyltransferase (TylF)
MTGETGRRSGAEGAEEAMGAIDRRLEAWRGRPLAEWPADLFDDLGIKNPNEPSNLSIVMEAIAVTRAVPGEVVECGVYRGSSLGTLGLFLQELRSPKRVWGLDSFQGFPSATAHDLIDGVLPEKSQPPYFADTSEELVRRLVRRLRLDGLVQIVAGYFEETCASLPVPAISVLWLDCDLYSSYKTCLEHLYRRVSPGGRIVFDEYYSKKYPGARVAVDEFFADKFEKPLLDRKYLQYSEYERWYVVKR